MGFLMRFRDLEIRIDHDTATALLTCVIFTFSFPSIVNTICKVMAGPEDNFDEIFPPNHNPPIYYP